MFLLFFPCWVFGKTHKYLSLSSKSTSSWGGCETRAARRSRTTPTSPGRRLVCFFSFVFLFFLVFLFSLSLAVVVPNLVSNRVAVKHVLHDVMARIENAHDEWMGVVMTASCCVSFCVAACNRGCEKKLATLFIFFFVCCFVGCSVCPGRYHRGRVAWAFCRALEIRPPSARRWVMSLFLTLYNPLDYKPAMRPIILLNDVIFF